MSGLTIKTCQRNEIIWQASGQLQIWVPAATFFSLREILTYMPFALTFPDPVAHLPVVPARQKEAIQPRLEINLQKMRGLKEPRHAEVDGKMNGGTGASGLQEL